MVQATPFPPEETEKEKQAKEVDDRHQSLNRGNQSNLQSVPNQWGMTRLRAKCRQSEVLAVQETKSSSLLSQGCRQGFMVKDQS
jgi:hypothetical protein